LSKPLNDDTLVYLVSESLNPGFILKKLSKEAEHVRADVDHEFDYGWECLCNFVEGAQFDIVSSNLEFKKESVL